jgi:hypothetical protein
MKSNHQKNGNEFAYLHFGIQALEGHIRMFNCDGEQKLENEANR